MYLNQFSVRIPEGHEKNGYVEMEHDTQYTLRLRNSRNVQCDARVEIDGKHIGTWRIYAGSSAAIEHPVHDDGRFTFYRAGSREAQQAGLHHGDPNLGLVKVTFTPEKHARPLSPYPTWITDVTPNVEWRHGSLDNSFGVVAGASSDFMCGESDEESNTLGGSGTQSRSATPKGASAGGTGLSGKSYQQYGSAWAIEHDLSQQTVIHLRLVARNGDGPRPLTSFSTPVPPPV
jgi:hypothetical protein